MSFNYRSKPIMATPSKNYTNKIPSLCHKTLKTNLFAEVCTLSLFFIPPYSPGLSTSDFHTHGPLKDALRGLRVADDDDDDDELRHSGRGKL